MLFLNNDQGTNSKCPFYRGVRLKEVSVKRESTVLPLFDSLEDGHLSKTDT